MSIPIDFVIRSAGIIEPDTFRAYAERRLAFALDRFENQTRSVNVRIHDINGPKRGVDSHCSITLKLRDGRHLEVESVTAWPFASITLAAKRLKTALQREVDKARVAIRRGRTVQPDRGA
jgi:ribosome-associated translation inhibitor RaiA